jgi:hypothetical protein
VFVVRDQEAGGSNPLAPTNYLPFKKHMADLGSAQFCADRARECCVWSSKNHGGRQDIRVCTGSMRAAPAGQARREGRELPALHVPTHGEPKRASDSDTWKDAKREPDGVHPTALSLQDPPTTR